MEIEFKHVGVTGVRDEGDGIVTAIVSVTGIKDNVNDIIDPGAYEKTLAQRTPKGVWHHSWTEPVAKTLEAKELMPGDSALPKKLPNGDPWPAEAGALQIKMKFNLDGARGQQAYSDVKFFDNEQEWSIGYNVPTGGATVEAKSGIRRIKTIDLYEYSPVLFGAMPAARTSGGVKEAQLAFKSFMSMDVKGVGTNADGTPQDPIESGVTVDDVEDLDPEDFDLDDDFDNEGVEETTKSIKPATLRKAISALEELLSEVVEDADEDAPSEATQDEKEMPNVYLELKAIEFEDLSSAVEGMSIFEGQDAKTLQRAAEAFDRAVKGKDQDVIETAAGSVLDVLEDLDTDASDEEDGEKSDAIRVLTRVVADVLGIDDSIDPRETSEKKLNIVTSDNYDMSYVMVKSANREFGYPIGSIDAGAPAVPSTQQRQEAFLAAVEDVDLVTLARYVSPNDDLKSLVDHEAHLRAVASGLDVKNWFEGYEEEEEDEEEPTPKPKRTLKRKPKGKMKMRGKSTDRVETKRQFTADQLEKLGKEGNAFKNANGDWSYPVETRGDLENAVKAYGRCMEADQERLRSYLKKQAKRLSADELIPDKWEEKTMTVPVSEFKDIFGDLSKLNFS